MLVNKIMFLPLTWHLLKFNESKQFGDDETCH